MPRKRLVTLFLIPLLVLSISAGCGLGRSADEIAPENTATPRKVPGVRSAVEIGKYLVTVGKESTTTVGAMLNLVALLQSPEVGNPQWLLSVRTQIATIRKTYDRVIAIKPPPEVEPIHRVIVAASKDCVGAVDTVLAAVDNPNEAALSRAIDQGLSCTNGFDKANLLIEELGRSLDDGLPDLGAPELRPASVNRGANIRQGPGTNYPRLGGLAEGTVVAVTGRNEAGDWLVIETQGIGEVWIAAFLVDNPPDLATLPVIPAP